MGWFDSFFSGLSNLVGSSSPSVADAAMGGTTDLGALAASTPSFASDAGSWLGGGAGGGLGSLFSADLGGIGGANPTTFVGGSGGSSSTPMFDPNTVGPPPTATPTAGTGTSTAGLDIPRPGTEDAADPETFARQGQSTNSWNPATSSPVGSTVQPPPPPTAWESIQQTPGKWWQGAQDAPGRMVESFNRDPFGNSLKLAGTAASIGVPLAAALNQPRPPKMPDFAPQPGVPLPGTTGIGRADLPAGSPMSPNLGPAGGFNIGVNQGLKKKTN